MEKTNNQAINTNIYVLAIDKGPKGKVSVKIPNF